MTACTSLPQHVFECVLSFCWITDGQWLWLIPEHNQKYQHDRWHSFARVALCSRLQGFGGSFWSMLLYLFATGDELVCCGARWPHCCWRVFFWSSCGFSGCTGLFHFYATFGVKTNKPHKTPSTYLGCKFFIWHSKSVMWENSCRNNCEGVAL